MTKRKRSAKLVRRAGLYADLLAAPLVFTGVLLIEHYEPRALSQGVLVLATDIAVGGVILGLVLTALAILVSLIGDEYMAVLRSANRGIAGVVRPYELVAVTGAGSVGLGLLGLICWPIINAQGQALLMALSVSLTLSALIGMVQLVYTTATHGKLRVRFLEQIAEWKQMVRASREKGPENAVEHPAPGPRQ